MSVVPVSIGPRPILITGGAGFIGCNLADRLAGAGHPILIYDSLCRPGVERNRDWLAGRHRSRIAFAVADVRDTAALEDAAANAACVFHLAAQVAVTTSLVTPEQDFAVNAASTLRLLEILRKHNPSAPLIFASTNKVYGDLADLDCIRTEAGYAPRDALLAEAGIAETRPLDFHTPYGCSKGAADQYVLDYARSFGLKTTVLRMSCIYGERQLGTEDQGWVAHFLLRAIAGDPLTLYGDGWQVRDILHVTDAVAAYEAAWHRIDQVTGQAFNLGGGPANAVSLRALTLHIADLLGRPVDIAFANWRQGDQKWFVADTRAARAALGLPSPIGWRRGVARLAAHFGAAIAPALDAAS